MLVERLVRLAEALEEIAPTCDYAGEMFDAALALRAGETLGEVLADMSSEARNVLRQTFVAAENRPELFTDSDLLMWLSVDLFTDSELLLWMVALGTQPSPHQCELASAAYALLVGKTQEEALACLSEAAATYLLNAGSVGATATLQSPPKDYLQIAFDEFWEKVKEKN